MIAFGFGCIEVEEREKIKRYLVAALMRGETAYQASDTWNAERKKYDEMSREEAPERYTTFHVYDGAIHYLHTSRRYPFSPDGWAALQAIEPLEEKRG